MTFDANFYNEEYFEGTSKSGYGGQYREMEFGEKTDRVANFIHNNFVGPVLDVGCAYGYLVSALGRLSMEAQGIDISEYAVSKPAAGAEGKLRTMDITKDKLEDPPFGMLLGRFNTVVSIQTLEHIPLEYIPIVVQKLCRISMQTIYIECPTWFDDLHPDHRATQADKSHVSFYSASFWISEFHRNGFVLDLNLSHKLMGTDSSRLIFYKQDNVPLGLQADFSVTQVSTEAEMRTKWEDHYGPFIWHEDGVTGNVIKPVSQMMIGKMKILVISTSIYRVPLVGYGGLEQLAYEWAVEFQKRGHKVALVAPEGSTVPLGMELITMPQGELEAQTFERYKGRLHEFDVIMDNSWLWYTVLAQLNTKLPVVHIYHSDPEFITASAPPIDNPCVTGISQDHAARLAKKWGIETRYVYNGVPLDFYARKAKTKRSNRYLWIARYTPEKNPLEAIRTARKMNIELDLYGTSQHVHNQDYLNQCMMECDAKQIVLHNEATRKETVGLYNNHKALFHLVGYNEAFGLVPVEAMACGLPVIVNKRGALPELVENGVSGFVVDDWTQVEELIRTDAVSTIKPAACRKQAEKFSIAASADGYLKLFADVIGGRSW